MNWIHFFLILYAIYFIAAILITLGLYLRMIWIDLENEETGVYASDEEFNKH